MPGSRMKVRKGLTHWQVNFPFPTLQERRTRGDRTCDARADSKWESSWSTFMATG